MLVLANYTVWLHICCQYVEKKMIKHRFYYQPVKTLSNSADSTDAATDLQQFASVSLTDDCDVESCTAATTTAITNTTTVAQTSTHSTSSQSQVQSSLTSGLRAALIGQAEVQQVEEVCYICAHFAPNAVLLGCGHSGLCYTCAELLVRRKRSGVPKW
jgi:Zinc finger, C3HC4 type (RING finger)